MSIVEGLARGLPLLLILTVFLVMQAELWQVAYLTDDAAYIALLGLMIGLGLTVTVVTHARRSTARSPSRRGSRCGRPPSAPAMRTSAAHRYLSLCVQIPVNPEQRKDFFAGADRGIQQRLAIRLSYLELVPEVPSTTRSDELPTS